MSGVVEYIIGGPLCKEQTVVNTQSHKSKKEIYILMKIKTKEKTLYYLLLELY